MKFDEKKEKIRVIGKRGMVGIGKRKGVCDMTV